MEEDVKWGMVLSWPLSHQNAGREGPKHFHTVKAVKKNLKQSKSEENGLQALILYMGGKSKEKLYYSETLDNESKSYSIKTESIQTIYLIES